jgi:hypothetical protein
MRLNAAPAILLTGDPLVPGLPITRQGMVRSVGSDIRGAADVHGPLAGRVRNITMGIAQS